MHELSIAQGILDIVCRAVPEESRPQVRIVRLRVGELSGVVPDSLDFSFTALTANTPLAASRLAMEELPYVVHCRSCDATERCEPGLRPCPRCGGVDTEVVSGLELQVTEIELEDDQQEAA
jgi:hydrogenase nickel incorporation protein HypA/HybF